MRVGTLFFRDLTFTLVVFFALRKVWLITSLIFTVQTNSGQEDSPTQFPPFPRRKPEGQSQRKEPRVLTQIPLWQSAPAPFSAHSLMSAHVKKNQKI